MRLLEELKRRKVFQAAAGYAVVAWILLQIGEVTFEPMNVPDWVLRALIVMVIAGFPVVLLLSWFFDLTRRGWKRDAGASPDADPAVIASATETPRPTDAASIAVLSFDDMSPQKDQQYLCDGVAEEILNRLAQVESLRVASRTSSFRFKGQHADIGAIASTLRVANVLEGSIRKSGERLRITTQLISAENGYHLWAHTYDRDLHDIFAIEDEIASEVAQALQVKLGSRSFPDTTTEDCRAYDYYLRGMHYFGRWGLRNVEFAIDMFERAVQIDPAYARAWAALSDSHAMICMYWQSEEGHLDAADRASSKALELGPDLAEAHVARGLTYSVRCDHQQAVAEFEEALRLNPDLFAANYFYARVAFQSGNLERAAELFESAERTRPEDFQSPVLLRQIYHSLGREEDARRATERGVRLAEQHLALHPDDTRALNLGLGALAGLGEHDKARKWAVRSLTLDGRNADTLYNVACGYALMGDTDDALDCLTRAGLHGTQIGEWAENDSDLESLHDDPRFAELVARLKGETT